MIPCQLVALVPLDGFERESWKKVTEQLFVEVWNKRNNVTTNEGSLHGPSPRNRNSKPATSTSTTTVTISSAVRNDSSTPQRLANRSPSGANNPTQALVTSTVDSGNSKKIKVDQSPLKRQNPIPSDGAAASPKDLRSSPEDRRLRPFPVDLQAFKDAIQHWTKKKHEKKSNVRTLELLADKCTISGIDSETSKANTLTIINDWLDNNWGTEEGKRLLKGFWTDSRSS